MDSVREELIGTICTVYFIIKITKGRNLPTIKYYCDNLEEIKFAKNPYTRTKCTYEFRYKEHRSETPPLRNSREVGNSF